MKKKLIGLSFFIAMLICISIETAHCGGKPERGDQSSTPRQAARANVRWDNDPNGTLILNNNVKEPLILFAGSVNNRNIIGGIRAESTRRIDFSDVVQEQSGTFLLRAVSESAYISKGSAVDSDDVIYAHIVTFNKRSPSVTQLTIDRRLGGQSLVVIENHTRMAMEIRLNSPDAETLTTLGPLEMNKKVYLDPDPNGYVFYPIFRYYDKSADIIQTVETDRGTARRMNPENPNVTGRTITMKFDNIPADRLTFRFATIIVRNEGEEGIFLMEGGGTRLRHQNGGNLVNPGNEKFEIFLDGRAQEIAFNIDYFGKNYPVNRQTYRPGYTYQITFASNGVSKVDEIGAFDINDLSLPLVNQR